MRYGARIRTKTARAEEVEISASGVRARADRPHLGLRGRGVERVAVALQDLMPFEVLERSRAEF